MKTRRLTKTLKRTLTPKLRKSMLAILCVALVASLSPLQGIAQASEDELASTDATSTSALTTTDTDELSTDTTEDADTTGSEVATDADTTEDATETEDATSSTDTSEDSSAESSDGSLSSDSATTDSSDSASDSSADATEATTTDATTDTDTTSPIIVDAATLLSNIETLAVLNDTASDDFYITEFTINSITDGTADFDTCYNDECQDCGYYYAAQGNDSGPNNGIVRSFDTVTYDLLWTADAHDGATTTNATLYFEFILPLSATEAEWETDAMSWMQEGSWSIDEKTISYDFDGSGEIEGDEENVSCQVLRGAVYLDYSSSGQQALPGSNSTGSMEAVVQVLASTNGTELNPVFTIWVAGSKTGTNTLSSTDLVTGSAEACGEHGYQEYATAEANGDYTDGASSYTVTVTAELRINVDIATSSTDSYNPNTYNFSNTGNDYALDKDAGEVYGQYTEYAIVLQLYNYENKGFKGIEYPSGDIEIELTFSTAFYTSDGSAYSDQTYIMENYTPLVWAWGQCGASSTDGRMNSLANRVGPTYAGLTTSSNLTQSTYNLYGSRTVTAEKTDTTTVTFTVSNYSILYPYFPSSGYYTTYYTASTGLENIGAFASLGLALLTPFENSEGISVLDDLNVENGYFKTTVELTGLSATSASGGQTISLDDDMDDSRDSATSIDLNINKTFSTASSYTTRAAWSNYDSGFWSYSPNIPYDVLGNTSLNSGSWSTNGGDTIQLGATVGLWGGLLYLRNGDQDNQLYALDVLVKFDGSAVTPTGNWKVYESYFESAGLEASVLWATLPSGDNWATDSDMNSATIESLVYYSSLNEVPTGDVVVAYLLEVRPKDGDASSVPTTLTGTSYLLAQVEAVVNEDESLLGGVGWLQM